MPLSKELLKTELQKFSDPLFELFTGHPQDKNEMANKWADAIDTFIKPIVPVISSSAPAKAAFKSNMLTQVPPIPNAPYYEPFTIGYKSPENALFLFITYLNNIGYKSNPALDKASNLAITTAIRNTYNIAFPNRKLTENDIKYNQSRHNQVYALVIANQTRLPLPPLNIYPESGYTKNYEDGSLIRGPLSPLQVDGLVGDDTILYKPFIVFNEIQQLGKITTQSYRNQFIIDYADKVEGEPSDSGDISLLKYTNGVDSKISKDVVYAQYIKTGKLKDYLKFPLDKTQSDQGETNWALESGGISDSKKFDFYKKAFEVNHTEHDPFWKSSGIRTISQLNTLMRAAIKAYEVAPANKKDSIKLLEDSLLIHAQNIAVSMLPTFTASAPPNKIDLSAVSILGNSPGTTSEQVINLLSTLILTWYKTGIATNNTTGVTVTWL